MVTAGKESRDWSISRLEVQGIYFRAHTRINGLT
jgi:hypothetical protein